MRIRSLKPEFWTNEDIAALDWDTRLVFVGLSSYVDDNGVGRDVEKLIVADLFPLEDDYTLTLERVSRALASLAKGGQVLRYTVDGKPFLFMTTWKQDQRIDRPSAGRYPLPTSENALPRYPLDEDSRVFIEGSPSGTGEQGNRGTEQTPETASSDQQLPIDVVTPHGATEREPAPGKTGRRSLDDDFKAFWNAYPRKTGGPKATRAAWDKARKDTPVAVIQAGVERFRDDPNRKQDPQFIPHATTWLNGGRWADEPAEPAAIQRSSGRPGVPEGW